VLTLSIFYYLFGLAFLLLFLLLIILLFSPLKYRFELTYKENLSASFSAKIIPLVSLKLNFQDYRFDIILRFFGLKTNFQQRKEKKSSKKKDAKKEDFSFPIKLASKENFLHFLELLQDMYHIFRPQELRISGMAGFSEPHHTAWLLACLSFLPAKLQRSINIEPVWDEEYLEAEITAAGSILLCQVLLMSMKFLLSKKTRHIWRQLKQKKKLSQHAT
jgi:hypothetical protein